MNTAHIWAGVGAKNMIYMMLLAGGTYMLSAKKHKHRENNYAINSFVLFFDQCVEFLLRCVLNYYYNK